jgi:hypothetical protein
MIVIEIYNGVGNPVGDGKNIYDLTINNLEATGAIGDVTVTTS